MQQGMAAFGGNALTYHIALFDKPTIIWDFHSLLLGIQMMFSFMLTDAEKPMRMCKHCTKAFVANRPSAVFAVPNARTGTMFTRAERKTRTRNREVEDFG